MLSFANRFLFCLRLCLILFSVFSQKKQFDLYRISIFRVDSTILLEPVLDSFTFIPREGIFYFLTVKLKSFKPNVAAIPPHQRNVTISVIIGCYRILVIRSNFNYTNMIVSVFMIQGYNTYLTV